MHDTVRGARLWQVRRAAGKLWYVLKRVRFVLTAAHFNGCFPRHAICSGLCKADTPGSFLVECTVTQGSAYAVIDFANGKSSAHTVGPIKVQLQSQDPKPHYKLQSKDQEADPSTRDPMATGSGIDAYVRCPNAP